MESASTTPSLRKYPQRNRKKPKYWFDESDLSMEETPPIKKVNKRNLNNSDSNESSHEKENNEGSDANEDEEDGNEEISEYEKLRLKNVEENRRIMMELGLFNPKNEKKEVKAKPKPKPKPKEKAAPKKPLSPRKRSLRLLRKTPDGKDLPLTFEDTPQTPEIEEKTRIEEETLPMNEDGSITDFLDSLKLSLSQGTSSQSSVESTQSLIDEMRNLEFASIEKVTKARVQSMCIHPMENNLLIAVGSKEGELGLWNVNNQEVISFHPHLRNINCVSVSHNNPYEIFTTSFEGTVRRADINKSVFDLVYQSDEKRNMCHLTWHSQIDSNTLIIAHGTGEAGVVDLRAKAAQRWFHCHPKSMRTIHPHPSQPQYFLTSSGSGEAKIWDLRVSKKHIDEPVSTVYEGRSLTSAFFSPDGNKAVSTGNDDKIRIFDTSNLSNPRELHSFLHDNHTGRWLSVFKTIWHNHSSDLLFVGSMLQPRRIQMYNSTGKLVREVMDEDQLLTVVPVLSFHPTLPIIVGGNASGKAHVFTTPQYIGQFFD